MPQINVSFGQAGVRPAKLGVYRLIFKDGTYATAPNNSVIDGVKSRDPGNSPETFALRPGLILAKNATTGRYATWSIGEFQAATLANATTFTLTVAAAAELVRRIGPSGSLTVVGSATASGALVTEVVTYTGVNTGTGAVTVNAMTSAFVAGSVVTEANFTVPSTFIAGTSGEVVPTDGTHLDWAHQPIAGVVIATNLIPYPTATNSTLRNHVKNSLSTLQGNKFIFDDSI